LQTGFSNELPCVIGWIEDDKTSLRVVFDNARYIDYVYSNCRDSVTTLLGNHKITARCGHQYIGFQEEKGHIYKWTFTREDYNDATLL